MIIAIGILSLLFICIGFVINTNNACFLLSGYNILSEAEQKNFNLIAYVAYFRRFHVFLGVSLFIVGVVLYYYVDPSWSGVFMTTYPLFAYMCFMWQSNAYWTQLSVKQKRTSTAIILLLAVIFIGVLTMFYYTLADNKLLIEANKITITGNYGMEVNRADILSIKLVNELPEIINKQDGFALENIQKGTFKTADGKLVKLYINSINTPIICITTQTHETIYYTSKNESSQVIYTELESFVHQ